MMLLMYHQHIISITINTPIVLCTISTKCQMCVVVWMYACIIICSDNPLSISLLPFICLSYPDFWVSVFNIGFSFDVREIKIFCKPFFSVSHLYFFFLLLFFNLISENIVCRLVKYKLKSIPKQKAVLE